MDTFCQKYSESVPEDDLRCRHLKDYCKFRTGCIVFFMSEEDEERRTSDSGESVRSGSASAGET